ncbi:DNA-binding protein [Streptomyces sp. ICBB 8177]|nr:DNA-binding protein [Streptomyces sp. ICBB 8177]
MGCLSAAAYLADERGHILAVNESAVDLLARPASELVGRDAHEALHRNRHGGPLPGVQCAFKEAVLGGRTAQGREEWLERGDGALLPVGWLATPYGPEGRPSGSLVIFWAQDAPESPAARPRQLMSSLTELERLALLAETTTLLSTTLDVEEALSSLVRLVVPRLADWAVIDLITKGDEVRRFAVAHCEDGEVVYRDDLQGPMPPVPEASPMPLSRALRGAAASLTGPETYNGPPDAGIAVEQRRLFEATGMHSAAIAPILSHRRTLGALTLGRSDQPERFTPGDLALLEDITRRAGLALDNALLYERQRRVAETMQRYLLPRLPRVKGLRLAARYLPAPDASQVGGDWYDAFTLTDGTTALAVGDVVGHDLEAAAGMAQLRNMLRAYAWMREQTPSEVVDWLDHATGPIAQVSMATLIFARLATAREGQYELTWTNAGHPPPLLISYDGVTSYLTGGHGVLLGTGSQQPRPEASVTLRRGDTLVLYTDGLVEAPDRSIDEGLEILRRHAASLAHRPLESFIDLLLERTRPTRNEDDVAVLAIRVPAEPDLYADLLPELPDSEYSGL